MYTGVTGQNAIHMCGCGQHVCDNAYKLLCGHMRALGVCTQVPMFAVGVVARSRVRNVCVHVMCACVYVMCVYVMCGCVCACVYMMCVCT